MIDIDTILPQVLRYVPMVPDIVAYSAINEAARKLCEVTKEWTHSTSVAVTAAPEQDVPMPTGSAILEIQHARLDETTLDPRIKSYLDAKYPDWQESTEENAPRYITSTTPDTVTLYPLAAGTLKVRLILKPSLNALELPDFCADYGATLGRGAAGSLLVMPNRDFANPQLGMAHIAWFDAEMNRLQVKRARTQLGAPVRTKPRFF